MTTPTKKTPTWLIERVAQKELGATEVEQIRVRLAAEGSSLEAEVDLLQRSDREILTQFPRQTMAKEIRRRAVGARPIPTQTRGQTGGRDRSQSSKRD